PGRGAEAAGGAGGAVGGRAPGAGPGGCRLVGVETLSLHDALPIWIGSHRPWTAGRRLGWAAAAPVRLVSDGLGVLGARARQKQRSEEHTSELQSPYDLVCRLLLENKKRRPPAELVEQLADEHLAQA